MFKEIDDYNIIVSIGNSDNVIPNLISPKPLDQLLKATEWLVSEAVKDWDSTHKEIEQRRKTKGASKENLDAYSELSIRLGSRTQGYVNQLCIMEDILKYEYKRMAEFVTNATANKITIKPENDYKSLVDNFYNIRKFRNKVTAHTAYTKRELHKKGKLKGKPVDNPETIVRSIINLFPSDAKHTLGDNFFVGGSPFSSKLPVISIFNWENEIKPIFESWKKLFIEALEKVHSFCPHENGKYKIRVRNPRKIRSRKSSY